MASQSAGVEQIALYPSTCRDSAHQPHHRNPMSPPCESVLSRCQMNGLQNRALNPAHKSRDHLTSHQSSILQRIVDLASFIILSEPSPLVFSAPNLFTLPFEGCERKLSQHWRHFALIVMPGMSVNQNKLLTEQYKVSLSASFCSELYV